MLYLVIGNAFSFIAAIFTAMSSLSRDTYKVYIYQMYQCLMLTVASVFFMSWSGIVTLLLCSLRNYMAAKELLTPKRTVLLTVLMFVIGGLVNNRGLIGWLIVIATALYTVGIHFAHSELAIKGNIAVNLILWIIYEIYIKDISSLVMDVIALVLAAYAIVRALVGVCAGSGASEADGCGCGSGEVGDAEPEA